VLHFRGQVVKDAVESGMRLVDVLVRADTELGNHLTATVRLTV
jgi:hypothetical protein